MLARYYIITERSGEGHTICYEDHRHFSSWLSRQLTTNYLQTNKRSWGGGFELIDILRRNYGHISRHLDKKYNKCVQACL